MSTGSGVVSAIASGDIDIGYVGIAPTLQGISNGVPVNDPNPERGFVFRQYSLFPWRIVLDNVAFGLEVRGMASEERYMAENI